MLESVALETRKEGHACRTATRPGFGDVMAVSWSSILPELVTRLGLHPRPSVAGVEHHVGESG
ncbi:MAG: hypothetical protein ACC654_09545 [Acidimicrobiia bacterium]